TAISPRLATRTLANGGATLLQDDQDVALVHRRALGAADLRHRAGLLGLHGDLHLHGLEDDDGVALLDGVADRDLDLPDVRGHRGLDLGQGFLLPAPTRRARRRERP